MRSPVKPPTHKNISVADLHQLEPLIRIGKQGITPQLVEHLKKAFVRREYIKVKFLAAALEEKDKKTLFKELADAMHAEIVLATGFVVVIKRPKRRSRSEETE